MYFALARYLSNGSADTTFGGTGRIVTNFSGSTDKDWATDVVIQTDGKIVVSGVELDSAGTNGEFAIARYTSTGALDTTFSTNGKESINFGVDARTTFLALQADGKYLLAGFVFDGTQRDYALARVLP
jgi:uncharacterized delta-60 repeat protein